MSLILNLTHVLCFLDLSQTNLWLSSKISLSWKFLASLLTMKLPRNRKTNSRWTMCLSDERHRSDTCVCIQEGGKLRAKGIHSKLKKMTCFVTIKSKGIITGLLNFGLFPFWFSSVEQFPSSQIYFWAMWKVYLSPSNTDPSIRDSVLHHITGTVFPMRWSLDILHVYCLFLVLHVLSELL